MSDDERKPGIPAYFSGQKEKKKRRKSMDQEERIAKTMSGYRVKASGALPGSRGDVKGKELLGECKRTDNKSISVSLAYLEKIVKEAAYYNKLPAVAIEFDNPPRRVPRDWVLLPAGLVQEMLEAYRERGE